MTRTLFPVCALLGGWLLSAGVWADDFQIVVTVTSGDEQVRTERTEQSAARQPAPARPTVMLDAAQTATISWHAENTSEAVEFTDVLVHFFVVEQERPGQPQVPDLQAGLYEGAMTMDFKPGEKADWQFKLQIDKPGSYLLRVETVGLAEVHGHEHFAALDLIVE